MNLQNLTDNQLIKLNTKEAKEILFNRYKNFIKKFAASYANKGIDFDDLYQEASLGFLKAIDNFNPNLNTKFSAFVYIYIEGFMKNLFNPQHRLISLPKKYVELSKKIEQLKDKYSEDEIIKILDITREEYDKAIKTNIKIISYNSIDYSNPEKDEFINLIPDEELTIEEILIQKEMNTELLLPIYEIIFDLPKRNQFILIHSYGLFDSEIYSPNELQTMLGMPISTIASNKRKSLLTIINTLNNKPVKTNVKKYIVAKNDNNTYKFKSVKQAAEDLNLNKGKIREAIQTQSEYGGYLWKRQIMYD